MKKFMRGFARGGFVACAVFVGAIVAGRIFMPTALAPTLDKEHAAICFTSEAYEGTPGHIVMRDEETGGVYSVGPLESLEDAMRRTQEGTPDEGNCYPEGYDGPLPLPDDAKVECKCWQVTECDPNATEERSCKRYCRKHRCDCCNI